MSALEINFFIIIITRRTVSIIYKMCSCLSQLCNTMQADHAMYLISKNVIQEGIWILNSNLEIPAAEKQPIWSSTSCKIISTTTSISPPWSNKEWMATCAHYWWSKYLNPLKLSKCKKNISKIHHHDGVNIKACIDAITAPQSMALLSSTYSGWQSNFLPLT